MRIVTRTAAALAALLQRLDGMLRTWAVAGLSLLILLLVLAGALLLDS
jgi:hypothetical protein